MKNHTMSSWRRIADKALARRQHLTERVKEEQNSLILAEKELIYVQEAQQLCQILSQKIQQSAHEQISRVVSQCLRAIFQEDPYNFRIIFERKRGKTEARLTFEREGNEVDPRNGIGGGCLDVSAFALRIACLSCTVPAPRKLIVLDEPFRFLKPPEFYGPRIVEMINTLSEELNMQIIMVQNVDSYKAGKIIQLV